MGEARRRKKSGLNRGFGRSQKHDFQLEFLSKEESLVLVEDELRLLTRKVEERGRKYYFVKLITQEIPIIGLAIPFVVDSEVRVKCLWQKLENITVEEQNQIINKHLKEVSRKIALKSKREVKKSRLREKNWE